MYLYRYSVFDRKKGYVAAGVGTLQHIVENVSSCYGIDCSQLSSKGVFLKDGEAKSRGKKYTLAVLYVGNKQHK